MAVRRRAGAFQDLFPCLFAYLFAQTLKYMPHIYAADVGGNQGETYHSSSRTSSYCPCRQTAAPLGLQSLSYSLRNTCARANQLSRPLHPSQSKPIEAILRDTKMKAALTGNIE
jgi:hypothetical protein